MDLRLKQVVRQPGQTFFGNQNREGEAPLISMDGPVQARDQSSNQPFDSVYCGDKNHRVTFAEVAGLAVIPRADLSTSHLGSLRRIAIALEGMEEDLSIVLAHVGIGCGTASPKIEGRQSWALISSNGKGFYPYVLRQGSNLEEGESHYWRDQGHRTLGAVGALPNNAKKGLCSFTILFWVPTRQEPLASARPSRHRPLHR